MTVDMTNTRLQPISWLASKVDLPIDYEQLCQQEAAARHLHDDLNVLPTIGCEVEVKWSSLFPELAKEYFGEADALGRFAISYADLSVDRQEALDEECARLDGYYKPRYEATVEAGIPMGNDAYWEFANRPTYSYKTLATEIKLLTEGNYIPHHSEHSLHMTLGGIAATGGGPELLLGGLELACGTPERILLATEPSKLGTSNGWARRGKDGVRGRSAAFLQMGQSHATEFRTLPLKRFQDVDETFWMAQMLGSMLMAYRQRDKAPVPVQAIGSRWPEFRSCIKELWSQRDLPAQSWGSPHRHPEHWQNWAECLRRRYDSQTPENQVLQEINFLAERVEEALLEL